jgi:hypothetical protein
MNSFRFIADKVRVWNFVEQRYNDGHITATGCHGGINTYQVIQYNEAKSQWWHKADEVLDRERK